MIVIENIFIKRVGNSKIISVNKIEMTYVIHVFLLIFKGNSAQRYKAENTMVNTDYPCTINPTNKTATETCKAK
mgnify:CR=1 FL=1